ncbi:MAG: nucleoid-associated protein, YbaB/EbfC family [Chloroflexi bacterium RBG_13_66_10]|nr:MAG: nucleoid-associated protein, YbaB/EbfC family [Chloroflexi bacterium RBG_13_66_10]
MGKGKDLRQGRGDLLAGLEQLQEELRRAQAELGEQTVEATAGGGAVRVVMSGTQECKSVTISPALLQEPDAEMVQDLLLVAVNQAIRDSRVLAAQRLGPLAGGQAGFGLGGTGEGGAA